MHTDHDPVATRQLARQDAMQSLILKASHMQNVGPMHPYLSSHFQGQAEIEPAS
jgi:hypothetical protein